MLFFKLIKYNKVFKVWSLVSGCIKKIYQVNFFFLVSIYSKQCFFEFKLLYLSVKKYALLLLQCILNKKVFIGGRVTYSCGQKQFGKLSYKKCLIGATAGMLSNFYGNITLGRVRSSLPDIYVFLHFKKTHTLLQELKRTKNIVIGLVNANENSVLIDYPIVSNTEYFYSSYFFCRLLVIIRYFCDVR
jgi:hypothetical protein